MSFDLQGLSIKEECSIGRRQLLHRAGASIVLPIVSLSPLGSLFFPHPAFGDDGRALFDVIKRSGHAPAFADAIIAAGLKGYLSLPQKLTIFVPMGTNFLGFSGKPNVDNLSVADSSSWKTFVESHIVRGVHHANDLKGRKVLFRSLAGTTIVLDALLSPSIVNRHIGIQISDPSQTGVIGDALHWITEPLAAPPVMRN